jgi:predicted RNA-binding protein YlxR (DUF448 family)
MPRRPPRTGATKRLRRCIVSGALRPKEEMIRFVIGPEGEVVADMAGRLPGRGFWLSAERDMINTACAKKAFSRAAGASLTTPPDLSDRVEHLLARRCLDLVGLACRAGEVVAGYDKSRAWLRAGKGSVLVAASDGAPGGRAKVRALAPDLPLLDLFSGAELGAALGRDSAGHAVLARGRLADRLRGEAMRLAGFRTQGRASPAESVST